MDTPVSERGRQLAVISSSLASTPLYRSQPQYSIYVCEVGYDIEAVADAHAIYSIRQVPMTSSLVCFIQVLSKEPEQLYPRPPVAAAATVPARQKPATTTPIETAR